VLLSVVGRDQPVMTLVQTTVEPSSIASPSSKFSLLQLNVFSK